MRLESPVATLSYLVTFCNFGQLGLLVSDSPPFYSGKMRYKCIVLALLKEGALKAIGYIYFVDQHVFTKSQNHQI